MINWNMSLKEMQNEIKKGWYDLVHKDGKEMWGGDDWENYRHYLKYCSNGDIRHTDRNPANCFVVDSEDTRVPVLPYGGIRGDVFVRIMEGVR